MTIQTAIYRALLGHPGGLTLGNLTREVSKLRAPAMPVFTDQVYKAALQLKYRDHAVLETQLVLGRPERRWVLTKMGRAYEASGARTNSGEKQAC